METKRRVYNYVVTNKEMFCDALARSLCQMNVPYVQVENEFHFDNNIYRFYNSQEFMELQTSIIFEKIEEEIVEALDPRSLVLSKDFDDIAKLLNSQKELVIEPPKLVFDDRKSVRFNSKQSIKNNNRKVKSKLRDNYNRQGYRVRQVNFF